MRTLVFLFSTLVLTGTVFATGVIDIAYSPYTITNPGSYIVVKDLTTAQNLDCIDILTSDVTIDLNGHTLYGSGSLSTSSYGIYDALSGGANNVTIFNGTIRNFWNVGIYLSGNPIQVSRVNVSYNAGSGIILNNPGLIVNCNVSHNGGTGIGLNQGSILDCNVGYNNLGGINSTGGIIRNNNIFYNFNTGILGQYGTIITGNQVSNNQHDGINGVEATISGNYSYNNTSGNGITASYGLVENNTVDQNSNGIFASYSRVVGNNCQNNTFSGIVASIANTVENNTLYGNSTGVFASSSTNYIAGNRFTNNTVSISTAAGNSLGDGTTGFYNKIQ